MTSFLIFSGWYGLGLIGTALILEMWWRRGGLPITIGDIIVGAGFALLGPISFLVGLFSLLGFVVSRIAKKFGVDFDTVVIRERW